MLLYHAEQPIRGNEQCPCKGLLIILDNQCEVEFNVIPVARLHQRRYMFQAKIGFLDVDAKLSVTRSSVLVSWLCESVTLTCVRLAVLVSAKHSELVYTILSLGT